MAQRRLTTTTTSTTISPHGHSLKIRAAVAGWLRSNQRELRCDVFGGQAFAARSDASAFEQIARQELHVRTNAFAGDVGVLRDDRARGQ